MAVHEDVKPRLGPGLGLGVDAGGGPVIDPTQNVIALTEAANKRQDDLRAASERRADDLRTASERYQELVNDHLKELADLRAAHANELAAKESSRIDSIWQVDQQNVSTTAQQTLTAVQTLAQTTARDQETLRTAIANMSTSLTEQTASQMGEFSKRVSALEQSSYEGKGKAGVSEPMMNELFTRMQAFSESRAGSAGLGKGMSLSWGILLGAVALIATILSIYSFAARSSPPQVIYAVPPSAAK